MEENPPQDPKLGKGRRYRRRHSNLRAEYEGRSQKHKWLETHIWHAKRMKMVTLWGHRLALHPNDRHVRSSHRSINRNCVLHDASYLQCVEIVGPSADVTAFLSAILLPFRVSIVEYESTLSVSSCPVGPVRVVTHPIENGLQVWLWLHPACLSDITSLLATIPPTLKVEQLALNRFELRGRLSSTVLHRALRPRLTHAHALEWSLLATPSADTMLRSGVCLAVAAEDPRLPRGPPAAAGCSDLLSKVSAELPSSPFPRTPTCGAVI